MPQDRRLGIPGILPLALLCSLSLTSQAQAAKSRFDKAKVIDQISLAFKENYVFPETAKAMETMLKKNLADGAYQSLDEPEKFAEKLSEDLVATSKDKHIRIKYLEKEPLSEQDTTEGRKKQEQELEASNFGFTKLEILSGNIGYIDLRGFSPAQIAGNTAVSAMNYMSHTRALIFDLRRNGGGDPSMIQLLTSYLFQDPVHLNSFYIRKTNSYEQYWTSAHVQGEKYLKQEVYVLTSGGTFSAAEEFSYNLKNLKRATLVGETTGGGAHPVNFHYLKDIKFAAMIPYGRAINPITQTNWEGVGVKPDVEVSESLALNKAHSLALEHLLKSSQSPEEKKSLTWSLETVKAQANPLKIKAEDLQSYVGQYGERRVLVEDGSLYYARGPRKAKLINLSPNKFALEGNDDFRLLFDRDSKGQTMSLSLVDPDGRIDKSEKNK